MSARAAVSSAVGVAATIVLLAGCAGTTDETPASTAGTVAVDGAQIWYQSMGSGTPVVAVHGGPGLDHSYLLPGLLPLSRTHRLIVYDQRGLGSSPTVLDSTSITMTRFLDDIDAIRRQVAGVEKVTLLAHSWGVIPAMLYAMRWPERVEKLILMSPVEPGQRFSEETTAAQEARRSPEDAALVDSIAASTAFREGDPPAVNRLFFHVFRGTFADPSVADSLFRPSFSERTARQGRVVASILMTPIAGLDFWDRLSSLRMPVLILHGEEDPIPVQMVRELADAFHDARLVPIAGAGHFPYIEKPDETFASIREFLTEGDQSP